MRMASVSVVALLCIAGCQSMGTPPAGQPPTISPASLVGIWWLAEDIEGQRVLDRVQSTLTFESPQRIAGRAACNQYFASVEQREGTVRIRSMGSTRMACPPPIMDQEQRFLSALDAVTRFGFDGGKLLLLDDSGRVRLRLAPLPPVSGAGVPVPAHAHTFNCGGGMTVVMIRTEGAIPGQTVDLVLDSDRRRLSRVPTASGERYADGDVSVWNKGSEAILELHGRSYTCTEDRPRSIREDAKNRGVEFRASGNEPGWIFELFSDRMAFLGRYGTERVITPRPQVSAGASAGETVYAAVSEAHRLTVRIREVPCVDSMSGDRYETTVEVELDGKGYRGCGLRLR